MRPILEYLYNQKGSIKSSKYIIDTKNYKKISNSDDKPIKVYRIKAVQNFRTLQGVNINKGDYGGYVESEKNLSQEGLCWVMDESCVIEDAQVIDNACVSNKSTILGHSIIEKNAYVTNSLVEDNCCIGNNTRLNNCHVYGYVSLQDNHIYANQEIYKIK